VIEPRRVVVYRTSRRTKIIANVIVWGALILIVIGGVVLWQVYNAQNPHLSAGDVKPGTMVGSDWKHLNAASKWTVIDFWPTTRDLCKKNDAALASNVDAFYAQSNNAQVTIEAALTLVLAQAGCLVALH